MRDRIERAPQREIPIHAIPPGGNERYLLFA
jgi:hypothetical protein